MQTPFTTQQFLDVFQSYNDAVWPMQIVFVCLALIGVIAAVSGRTARANRLVSVILVVFWLWMGIVYHFEFFSAINPLAIAFGTLFIVEGALLGWFGVWNSSLAFRPSASWAGVAGWILVIYALVGYPLLAHALGQRYPSVPTFGLPCPTTIFTIALLLWTPRSASRSLFVIPVIWSGLGLSAAITLGIREDLGLVVAGLLAATRLFQVRPSRPQDRASRGVRAAI